MTKRLMVGDVAVGGGAPVSIQSMCNTKTDDVRATVEQIHALEAAGCEIIRIAIPDQAAAEAVDKSLPWWKRFAFRYLLKAVNDGDLLGRAQFCALGVLVTDRLSRFVGLPEALRLFSREIEHNGDNLDTLLEQFWQTEGLSLSALLAAFGG